jgi:predicted DNA-binding transcriptional regulator YafY
LNARVEHTADHATRVTIRAVEMRAVVNFVLGFLDHVQIVEPPAARDAVIAALDAWDAA